MAPPDQELKRKSVEARLEVKGLMQSFAKVAHNVRGTSADHQVEPNGIAGVLGKGPTKVRTRGQAKRFEAVVSSFEEIINAPNAPMRLLEAFDRVRSLVHGPNFKWATADGNGHRKGGGLDIVYDVILWYINCGETDAKSTITCSFSFLHCPGVAYLYQPVVPVSALRATARQSVRPLFEMDVRSFHTFKLAWRHLMDFGVTEYRAVVGDELSQWTARCKAMLERPLDATYWLMLMVGSYYHEALAQRRVVQPPKAPDESAATICVDTLVTLSTLLFAPERQVLYAGTNPTPSYLTWLQYIAEQNAGRKVVGGSTFNRGGTVFENNEFLDLSVVVVYYGRVQHKVKESAPMSWSANPALVKGYIAKYMEDNHCAPQLEYATRLYSLTCSMGSSRHFAKRRGASEKRPPPAWLCWNGLKVCEVGVPMPSTHATFLSPFTTARPIAVSCTVHGLCRATAVRPAKMHRSGSATIREATELGAAEFADVGGLRPSRFEPLTRPGTARSSTIASDLSESALPTSDADSDSDTSAVPMSHATSVTSEMEHGDAAHRHAPHNRGVCSCQRYVAPWLAAGGKRRKPPTSQQVVAQVQEAAKVLDDVDVLHGFSAVLCGCLNLAKHHLRVHFGIDPKAFANFPQPTGPVLLENAVSWYKEFLRPDMHGRSRYTMTLERMVHGLLGDGFTTGMNFEALDLLRCVPDREREEAEAGRTAEEPRPRDGDMTPSRRRTNAAAAGGSTPQGRSPGFSGFQSPSPQAGRKPQKTALSDMKLWAELSESESVFTIRNHFDKFTPWCHSVHLAAFLRRCYRRSSIAGLLPHARSGGHKFGADPAHPLVLPTIRDFHYGYCYPFHRILQYFYGGVDQIVCSVDDPQEVEAATAALELLPGQDRMNYQCWFRPIELPAHDHHGSGSKELLTNNMLEQLQELITQSAAPSIPGGEPKRNRSRRSMGDGSPDSSRAASPRSERRISQAAGHASHRRRSSASVAGSMVGGAAQAALSRSPSKGGMQQSFSLRKRSRSGSFGRAMHVGMARAAPPQLPRPKPQLGDLAAEDPFFWFCHQSLALYTFPGRSVPMHVLNNATRIEYHYADFASRSGTPEPPASRPAGFPGGSFAGGAPGEHGRRGPSMANPLGDAGGDVGRANPASVPTDGSDHRRAVGVAVSSVLSRQEVRIPPPDRPPPPPHSVNVCQPTRMGSHAPRKRWSLRESFIDEEGLVLADDGWWPGAGGHRFSYEVRTENVARFYRLNTVPLVQLLYIEHEELPPKDEAARRRENLPAAEKKLKWLDGSSSSDNDSDASDVPAAGDGDAAANLDALGGQPIVFGVAATVGRGRGETRGEWLKRKWRMRQERAHLDDSEGATFLDVGRAIGDAFAQVLAVGGVGAGGGGGGCGPGEVEIMLPPLLPAFIATS